MAIGSLQSYHLSSIKSMRGFTLIELLVVMLIMAVAALAVVVNAPPLTSKLKDIAERISFAYTMAEEQSILSGSSTRLLIEDRAISFQKFSNDQWTLFSIAPLEKPIALPDHVETHLEMASGISENELNVARITKNPSEDNPKMIMIDPLGMNQTFQLNFRRKNEAWVFKRDENGRTSLSRG